MINHQPGRTTFRLGAYAAAHCITINGAVKEKANILAGSLIRDETEKLKAVILSQFVFADKNKYSPSFKTTVLDGAPVTRLNHAVPGSRGMFSAQALAISGMRNLEPVKVNGRKIGFVYEDDCARYCFLGNVFARNVKAPRGKQAEMVFETLAKALERHEFKFTDTVRTWFYNDRIIDWYGEFNKVRTGFFNKTGVFKKTVPASTGIGAGNPCGAALIGNLFAVLAMTTSFLTLGLALKSTYLFDFKLKPGLAWGLTVALPLIMFILGLHSFVRVIGLAGALGGSIEGLLILLIVYKLKNKRERQPEYQISKNPILMGLLALLFVGGIVYTLWHL